MQRLINDNINWTIIKDNNYTALQLYKRHYSFNRYRKSKNNKILPPSKNILLLTKDNKALLSWTIQKYRPDKQQGINCTIFRNESKIKSSQLLDEAEKIATKIWKSQKRFFTFINPTKIKSPNPGYCFKCNGWTTAGKTKKNLIILEKLIS